MVASNRLFVSGNRARFSDKQNAQWHLLTIMSRFQATRASRRGAARTSRPLYIATMPRRTSGYRSGSSSTSDVWSISASIDTWISRSDSASDASSSTNARANIH